MTTLRGVVLLLRLMKSMDIKIMKLSHAQQINKSRELGILLDSTLMQRRLLYSCMALMNPIVPEFSGMSQSEIEAVLRNQDADTMDTLRNFNIDLRDFAETWKIGGRSSIEKINAAIGYKENSSPKIMKMGFKYVGENGDITFLNVISQCTIKRDISAIHIRLTDCIVPYLINLASYTQLPFRDILGFKSNYSFTMLEHLLKRYVKEAHYPITELTLKELHTILATGHVKSYSRWTEFKTSVLDRIEKDFAEIEGGGYKISFEPTYGRSKSGGGRPSVSGVIIKFDDTGVRRFRNQIKARKAGLDHLEIEEEFLGRPRLAKLNHDLKKEKEKDLKRAEPISEQLSLAGCGYDFDEDEILF